MLLNYSDSNSQSQFVLSRGVWYVHAVQLPFPSGLSCIDKLVLLHIATTGAQEYSASSISQDLSIGRKSAYLSLKRLVESGYLEVLEEPSGRRGGVYRVATPYREGKRVSINPD